MEPTVAMQGAGVPQALHWSLTPGLLWMLDVGTPGRAYQRSVKRMDIKALHGRELT